MNEFIKKCSKFLAKGLTKRGKGVVEWVKVVNSGELYKGLR